MKGVIFTEFLEMVSSKFGDEIVEEIIDRSNLPSGGAYTTVGTYNYREIVSLSTNLSAATNIPLPDLLNHFGRHLFARFVELYPGFFESVNGSLAFLDSVETYIHVEVKKLYTDAELPRFESIQDDDNEMKLTYFSCRPLGDLCHGLIEGCLAHFNDGFVCERVSETADVDAGTTFYLRRAA